MGLLFKANSCQLIAGLCYISPMDKKAISNALDEAAVLMELAGDNPFRVRAYANASRIVRGYAGDLAEAVAGGVEVICYKSNLSPAAITLDDRIELAL